MPKMTKAEREAQAAKELESLMETQKAEFLPKLMTALERAEKLNAFHLQVFDGMFVLTSRESGEGFSLSPFYTAYGQNVLEELEFELSMLEEKRAEEQRRYEMKQAALSKLTAEERKLLGL